MEKLLTDEQFDEVLADDWMWEAMEKAVHQLRSMSDHEVRRELGLLTASMLGKLAAWRRAHGESIEVDPMMPTQIFDALVNGNAPLTQNSHAPAAQPPR